jgi:glycosyltransferase involved in cell wall biosynthesis
MKIALLSPFFQPVVEPFVGGTEAFVAHFAMALQRQGIEVVCYACEGSVIPGVEIRTCGVPQAALAYPRAPHELSGEVILKIRAYEDAVMHHVIEDVRNDPSIHALHNHSFSAVPLFVSHLIQKPIIHTLHLPPILSNMTEALRFCHQQQIPLNLVAISHCQAQLWQSYYPVNHVIYNGLAIDAFPEVGLAHEGTLAFVGRMDPTKGVEDAIAIATQMGKVLEIYGAPQPANRSYFETQIVPLLQAHTNVIYHGAVPQSTLLKGLRHAQALLFPVKWDEPFGNVILEAMAVGTPVIMYHRGAARELIRDGINGFVVAPDDLQAMVSAVEQTALFDRARCAMTVREQFHFNVCIEEYLSFLQPLLSGSC